MTRHSGGRGLVPREDTADARGTLWSRETRFRTKPAWWGTAVSTLWAPDAYRSVALRAERPLRFVDPLPDISCVGTSMRRSVYESRAVGALQQARSGRAGHDNATGVSRHPGQNDERRSPHVGRCKRSDTPAQTGKDRRRPRWWGALWAGRREPVASRGAAKAREWAARGEQLGCRAGTDNRRPGGSSLRRLASDEQTARSPPEHAHATSVHIVRRRLTNHEQPPNTPPSPSHTPTTTPPASVSPSRHPIARTRMVGEGRVLTTSPSA